MQSNLFRHSGLDPESTLPSTGKSSAPPATQGCGSRVVARDDRETNHRHSGLDPESTLQSNRTLPTPLQSKVMDPETSSG